MPTALIGDVVGSRDIAERDLLQKRLRSSIERINREYAHVLIGPFVLLRGDEIEAVLSQPSQAIHILDQIASDAAPHRLAWGIGHGELTTRSEDRTSEMDGPCFHQARAALEQAQRQELWVVLRGFGEATELQVNALYELLHAIRHRWTERQAEIVSLARRGLQKDVAGRLGVNPSVVSESLKAASFAAVQAGEEAAKSLLEEFTESPVTQETAGGPSS